MKGARLLGLIAVVGVALPTTARGQGLVLSVDDEEMPILSIRPDGQRGYLLEVDNSATGTLLTLPGDSTGSTTGSTTALPAIPSAGSPKGATPNRPIGRLEVRDRIWIGAVLSENEVVSLYECSAPWATGGRTERGVVLHIGCREPAERPEELSAGQRRRIGAAAALVSDPEMLLLDEPVAALTFDRNGASLPPDADRAVEELIEKIAGQGTVLLVTAHAEAGETDPGGLSRQRAEAVRELLIRNGIAPDHVRTLADGGVPIGRGQRELLGRGPGAGKSNVPIEAVLGAQAREARVWAMTVVE